MPNESISADKEGRFRSRASAGGMNDAPFSSTMVENSAHLADHKSRIGRRRRGPRAARGLAFLAGVQLRMLGVQFLLGTYLSLFVSLSAMSLFDAGVLVVHILYAFGLVVVSLLLVRAAVRVRNRHGIVWSAVSAFGMILALLAGSSFTFGGESNVASFVMAFGFFLGLISDSFLLGPARSPAGTQDRPGALAQPGAGGEL
jgi:hypothetical protein